MFLWEFYQLKSWKAQCLKPYHDRGGGTTNPFFFLFNLYHINLWELVNTDFLFLVELLFASDCLKKTADEQC